MAFEHLPVDQVWAVYPKPFNSISEKGQGKGIESTGLRISTESDTVTVKGKNTRD
jgi:hypothetical protein